MGTTKIPWADAVWNPVTGCSPVSPGCNNCYAKRDAVRLTGRYGYPKDEPFAPTEHPDRLQQPLLWKQHRFIFVPSMGDLFHPAITDGFRDQVLGIIREAKQHTFLMLTKRVEGMKWYFKTTSDLPNNLWLGASVESQDEMSRRRVLLGIPAAKHFLSIEPLLGKIVLYWYEEQQPDWVIVGGETGPQARPMHPDWVRSLQEECAFLDIPFFFKGWGRYHPVSENDPRAKTYLRDAENRQQWFADLGPRDDLALLDGREYRERPPV